MKYAIVNGERREAAPDLSGICPGCGAPMVARCGEINVWHWAHLGERICDHWWEPETEWHRNWKSQFPVNWQEIVHLSDTGEKHIADIKTDQSWVIEFQHSYLDPEERRTRSAFYPKLIWVVNGTRRKTDREQFFNLLNGRTPIVPRPLVMRVQADECRLLKEWSSSPGPVFFDFGEAPVLWWLLPKTPNGTQFVACFSRAEFIALHNGGLQKADEFASFLRDFPHLITNWIRAQEQRSMPRFQPRGRPSRRF